MHPKEADPTTHRVRTITRRSLLVGLPLAATGFALRGNPPGAAVVADADRASDRVLRPWGALPAEARGGTGVTVTDRGEVLLLHRGGAGFAATSPLAVDPVVVLDAATGEVRGTWGAGRFTAPHAISSDRRGRLWITDVTTNEVTVCRPDGTPDRTIGHDYGFGLDTCLAVRNELTNLPCTGDPYIFARPTDVAVAPDDLAYVADGYRNSRVARFDGDRFTAEWGALGDGAGEFAIPHGIALRRNGDVVVADRRNARVQVFDRDGRHLVTHASPEIGRPYDVAVGPADTLYVLDGGDALDVAGGQRRGYVVSLADNGSVTGRWALADQSADPHQLAVGPGGELYAAALTGPPLWRWAPA
ncbi:peptidyl-alpha-hydroxyglycine alpha-amidating lyase family protein [Actinosynnema sp. NPDC050436]|uniref:peptidyl-alpha-hydroxyglycine alpha-amidating lyase family protein n=1 Tax=Actinosynnema sp. NPDC050436 TaxID=3155659 RepID=UPI0033DC859F